MSLPELLTQLRQDASRAVPAFGAESVRLARSLGGAATELLLEQVSARGETAFLALEALRASDPAAYDALPAGERAEIYVATLRTNLFYNTWGLPRYHLTETTRAFLALKEDAVNLLLPLLADQRPAPLSGSQDATTSAMYKNRVCDYAWVFICEIRQRPYTYSQDPAERDRSIEALRQEERGGAP